MANNYSTTSLSAGGTQFFILENTNGDMLPTARAPSINKLSTYCTDATVALFKRVNCERDWEREGDSARDLVSQLASIELEPSIDQSGLNLEIKAFLSGRGQRSAFGHILRPLSKVLVRFSFFFKDGRVGGT